MSVRRKRRRGRVGDDRKYEMPWGMTGSAAVGIGLGAASLGISIYDKAAARKKRKAEEAARKKRKAEEAARKAKRGRRTAR